MALLCIVALWDREWLFISPYLIMPAQRIQAPYMDIVGNIPPPGGMASTTPP